MSQSHLDDLLSAYVDRQLTTEQQAVVDAHLTTCPVCRGELAATQQAKSWVTSLPEVLPPFGFYERMLLDGRGPKEPRSPWPVRIGAISLAATASIWLGVIGLGGVDRSQLGGLPVWNSISALHQAAAAPSGQAATATPGEIRQARQVGLAGQIDDLTLSSVTDEGDSVQAVYADQGGDKLSVFVYPHSMINVRALPIGSELAALGGHAVWRIPSDAGEMLAAERGDSVVVVVGYEEAAPAVAGEVDPPSPGRSIGDRIQDAGRGLLDAFGLG
jgi:anti-sigma factor RsiW